MAQESLSETPDISPPSSTAQSQPDPSLSRNVSFSRLNAQAPEFVPTRASPRADFQQPRLVVPPPPPPPASGILHVYSPPPTSQFHVPIQGHVVPVQNHHHHLAHQHHVPAHYRSHHHPHQYYVSSDSAVQQPQVDPDHAPSKSKMSDEASQKILNQVNFSCLLNMPISLLILWFQTQWLIHSLSFSLLTSTDYLGERKCSCFWLLIDNL